ncbi:MAG: hypothetical protein WCR31_06130 [Treponema sp.]
MCLVITAFAAVAATILWYMIPQRSSLKLGMLALMYWGASIMWTIDGFFSVAEGKSFLDLSSNDALLGLVIVLCGLIAWVMQLVVRDPKKILLLNRKK